MSGNQRPLVQVRKDIVALLLGELFPLCLAGEFLILVPFKNPLPLLHGLGIRAQGHGRTVFNMAGAAGFSESVLSLAVIAAAG